MKEIREKLLGIISIVAEHISLFATVIGSIYIVTTSQFIDYSTTTLLLWIISLVGFIALSIASERHFKLRKIDKNIENIQESLLNQRISLDEIFITRKELAPFEQRFINANEIVITGGSLCRLSDEYYGFFEKKLNEGCRLEIIMVKPNSKSSEYLCKNVVYETNNNDVYSIRINESLQRFCELKTIYKSLVKIYITENVPPFSLVAKNMNKGEAEIQVEIYSYAVPTRERIQFSVNKSNKRLFEFFKMQIETLRNQSEEYKQEDFHKSELVCLATMSPKVEIITEIDEAVSE